MTERDLDRQIGDALRRRADAFRPDEERAARRLLGRGRSRRLLTAGATAAVLALMAGASWWMLADRDDSVDVVTPGPESTTSPAPVDGDLPAPRTPAAIVIAPPYGGDQSALRGHLALMGAEGTYVEELGSNRQVALSPDGSQLVFGRPTRDQNHPAQMVLRGLADGAEEPLEGTTCPRFAADGWLATLGPDHQVGGTRLMAHDTNLAVRRGFHTDHTLYCAAWDDGGDRLMAVSRDEDERLTVWVIDRDDSVWPAQVEGLHPESHLMLGPAVGRGRFVVLAPSQQLSLPDVEGRWELGELIVEPDGSAHYEQTTELAAIPDWSHPDRTLLSPSSPVPLGMVHADIDDGALVFSRSDTPSYLVTDAIDGNLFAVDATGEVRYLTSGVGHVSTPPGGISDEHLGIPLEWPEWVTRAPVMDPSPCDGPAVYDLTGDGRADQVFHRYLGSNAVLGICTADGVFDSIAGRGQTELGGAIDLGPGRAVLKAGGTAVSWGGFDVAVVEDGRIRYVELDGEHLSLWDGHQGTAVVDPAEPGVGGAYGCEDLTGDGNLELVQVEVTHGGGEGLATWEKRGYRIEGTQASVVLSDSGTIEPTEYLWDAAATLTQPCPETE